jgi:hypothetical protein
MADLVETVPGGLDRYRPRLRYLLLDESTYSEAELRPLRNFAAALFRMENSRDPESLRLAVGALVQWLREPAQTGLRRAFTEWLHRVLLPGRFPGVRIPEVQDLQEVETMLAERVKEWTEQWRREGRQQGHVELLRRQLERRFGPLPARYETRLESADADTVLEWGERILTAQTVDDVFGGASR